ncbi:MAG: hypothetical protein GXY86_13250 [Firmicutes bacterium]|nr:hypothetical protein [Bacillota bacterium]
MGEDTLLFKNKYRIPSARLKGWDYSSLGWYFITICIKNKEGYLFGEVVDNEMRLNGYGQIVREEWENSFRIRRELTCRTYIIMPDHIHGLVGIIKSNVNRNGNGNANANVNGNVYENTYAHENGNGNGNVETHGRASLPIPTNPSNSINQNPKIPQRMPRSISSFVAGFKSAATKRINEMRGTPGEPLWQPRFYDRIIRDEKEFFAVQRYIDENPMRWLAKQSKNI